MNRPDSPPASSQVPPEEEGEEIITEILRSRLSQRGPWWNRRFPALLGLAAVTIGLTATVFLTLRRRQAWTEAAQPLSPQEIKISNLSSSSLTIFWLTSQETSGFVSYGRGPDLGQTALDDRDGQSGEPGLYRTHNVTLADLNPGATYHFKISSGGKAFDNEGSLFQVKTPPLFNESPAFDPAYGQIFQADGSPAEGAIVYLTIPGCLSLSTLVKASGGWLIAKNLTLEESLRSPCHYPRQGGGYDLLVQGGTGEKSRISLLSGLDKPVPDITLGQDYAFKDLAALKPLGTPQPTAVPTSPPAAPLLETPSSFPDGDLNHDGVVNTWDVAVLKSNFGDDPQQEEADLNHDGVVDQQDLDLLLEIFNQ